jgi:hypothetical protein
MRTVEPVPACAMSAMGGTMRCANQIDLAGEPIALA